MPSGWTINSLNMTFPNINAPNSTITANDYVYAENTTNSTVLAEPFQLPANQSALLTYISVYLLEYPYNETSIVPLNLSIFNAVYNSSLGFPTPGILLRNESRNFSETPAQLGWKNYSLITTVKLDWSSTYNGTFFVALQQEPSSASENNTVFWFFCPDNHATGQHGYGEYFNNTSGNWAQALYNVSIPIDYCLEVSVSVNNTLDWETPYPTGVNMEVNGTAVTNGASPGTGTCNLYQNLNISGNFAILNVSTTWVSPLIFNATITVYGINVPAILYAQFITTLTTFFFSYNSTTSSQNTFSLSLGLILLGAVVATGYGGSTAYRKSRIPLNAMKSLENIIVDHNPSGTMIWSFDFISMRQDVALVSGFISAIKSFLGEMNVGGLKRLSTEFGTFIREETQMLTATCITSDIGLDEELWIRNKMHEFLIQIEQNHYAQLENWKGDVGQFQASFPAILGSIIDLDEVRSLQRQKINELTRNKDTLQKKVNSYRAKLDELKSRHDSGELDFKKYIVERYKTEAKYDKVQKDYLYAGLFLARAPALLEERPVKAKDIEKIESIQNQFLQVSNEIEALRKKELEGSITSQDLERKENLQKELMTLIDKLDKMQKT
jgi:hypothetical protein